MKAARLSVPYVAPRTPTKALPNVIANTVSLSIPILDNIVTKNGMKITTISVWVNKDEHTNSKTLIITLITIGCLLNFSAKVSVNF